MYNQPQAAHRSGYIAVVGRPNVGKSTLINRILGEKVAIVSTKPQTTRQLQLGILSDDSKQLIFVDTPGLHRPRSVLGRSMMSQVERALQDADVILWLLDASCPPTMSDRRIAERLSKRDAEQSLVLALNKSDLLDDERLVWEHRQLCAHEDYLGISALTGENCEQLLECLNAHLPLGPRYFPTSQLSDANMRFTVAEIIRERILENCEQEVPHAVAVQVTSYQERSPTLTIISSVIYTERDSQRGILIGKGGKMIKHLGQETREALEQILGTQVHLDLRVKTHKNWRRDENFLRRLGYRLPDSERSRK